jgi:hypothetical protein
MDKNTILGIAAIAAVDRFWLSLPVPKGMTRRKPGAMRLLERGSKLAVSV